MEQEKIFENNMRAIRETFPKMAGQIITYMEQTEVPEVVWIDKSVQGEDILAVRDRKSVV